MPNRILLVPFVISVVAAANAIPAQAATCSFFASPVEGKHHGLFAKAVASKMSTACKRAKRKCERRLNRARRKGKVANRSIQCRRM